LLSLAWICHDRKQALPKNRLIAYPSLPTVPIFEKEIPINPPHGS
jgi:hypothetical protein